MLFIEEECGFSNIAGIANDLADGLSRDRLSSILRKVPKAEPLPTPLPPDLFQLLLDTDGTWTSPDWTRRFTNIAC